MLKNIQIKNFKSHKDTAIELKPTTIFIGPNNSGKSSVLQALQILKQSIKSGQPQILILPKPLERAIQRGANRPIQYSYPNLLIDVGNFDDILRKGTNTMTIKLVGEIPPISLAMAKRGIDSIYIDYEMTFRNNSIFSLKGKIQAGGDSINWGWSPVRGGAIEPASLIKDGINVNFQCVNQIPQPIQITGRSVPPDTTPEIQAEIDDFLQTLIQTPKSLLSSIFTISGIRGFEEQAYHLADVPSADMELMLLKNLKRISTQRHSQNLFPIFSRSKKMKINNT
ncbi:MAG: AAA family ATPase [archaeon]|nr:AAA family ATPase [archaeon]